MLAQLRGATDPETGERYTVKRYESEKAKAGDSWRHEKITLKPVNPAFEPIVLEGTEGDTAAPFGAHVGMEPPTPGLHPGPLQIRPPGGHRCIIREVEQSRRGLRAGSV